MLIPPLAPDATCATLVLDDDGTQARRFRTTTRLPDFGGLDPEGLVELRCSGSAQPSVEGFRDVLRQLDGVRPEALLVVDLRQESHGFVNGAAVSWYAESNWGAAGLSDAEALALEAERLRLLSLSPRVRVGSVEAVKGRAPAAFADWERHTVMDEARAFGLSAGHYVRLPVTDHTRPPDATVQRFTELVRGLADGAHLHLHCRGGKGRTATFMCLLDMLRNAHRLSLDTLLTRQAHFSAYDVRKAADPGSRKAPFIAERQDFIERFHAYARENPGGAPLGWLAWLARQPVNPEHKG